MMANQRFQWQNLLLILTVLPACRGLHVSIPQEEYEAASGEDITLTCSFIPANPDFKMLVVTWEAYPDVVDDPMKTVATYFLNNAVDIAPPYEGRAFMEVDLAQKQSTLRLAKLTVQDSRHFQCSVKIPNDDEGTTAASASLLVLVRPSKPLCSLQGTAEYWHDVTLTCMSEDGSPKPSYGWKSYSVESIPRPFPPKTTEKDGALSLFNISRETSGLFICTSTNRVGSESCNFTLAVMPSSMNSGSTIGIIVGVIAGLIVLGIIIFFCYKKRSQKDKNAQSSSREIEFSDTPEDRTQYQDEESNSETKKSAYKDDSPQNSHNARKAELRLAEDGSDSVRYQSERDQIEQYRGSRDRLDDQHNRGSRDRLEDRNDYRGSRDRLEDRNDHRGSRDRLDDRNDHRGSRDRLEEWNERRASQDRLDDQRNRHSHDRLDVQRYGGSGDHLEEREDFRGNRDRLRDPQPRYGGSRDRLNDTYER